MPWKEDFVAQLSNQGVSASESDLPDAPQSAWEAMNDIAQWWERLDSQAHTVLRYSGSAVVEGLRNAGFAAAWPQLLGLLSYGSDQVLPTGFNQIRRAWEGLRQSVDPGDYINDEGYEEYVAVKDAALAELSEY